MRDQISWNLKAVQKSHVIKIFSLHKSNNTCAAGQRREVTFPWVITPTTPLRERAHRAKHETENRSLLFPQLGLVPTASSEAQQKKAEN